MYIAPCNRDTIVSFIHGFETLAPENSTLTPLLRERLEKRYKISYTALGWPQMVEDVAKKWDMTYANAFKRITLEVLVAEHETLSENITKLLQSVVTTYIKRIREQGDWSMNPEGSKDWQWFVFIGYPWFKALWSHQKWKVIKKIDKEIKDGNAFLHNGRSLPAPALLHLRAAFDALSE